MAFYYIRRIDGLTGDKITGLDHLEGLSPMVMIDGNALGNYLVTSGEITLPVGTQSVSEVIVGLEYECELETLPMMIQSAQGIAYGQEKRIVSLGLYLYQTLGTRVEIDRMQNDWNYRDPADRMDFGPPLKTGFKEHLVEGNYTEETTIVIKQTEPFPLNINLMQITLDQSS